ncbi:hypothetical protein ELI38_14660 [Rhizobium leguminosarum]|uniref:Uncharacterized protein n=1 Tax=Rhizobium leguminosarum TaxID=384 RepID=A0A6P0D8A4_RHILE|nr:hypothetical protein CHR56_19740 [Rhizobium leguminosarum bv. viciae]NEI61220.1 hypothetical protein [Rhizobium leguminosarum]PUB63598.1 hypothetical protein DB728_18180 [Rhizobium leguminosarum bv. viciae USDA 2370]NEK49448.1 hypothetical protein [Rhizobium leguminosarum]NKJ80892.1 hypothetical protein [Rhizobium leguminosarum bv. viciae]
MIRITAPRVFQTRKGRCNTFNPRIVLSKNRFRFSGRCDTACASPDACAGGLDAESWAARPIPETER